jgi:hypothetical protein
MADNRAFALGIEWWFLARWPCVPGAARRGNV